MYSDIGNMYQKFIMSMIEYVCLLHKHRLYLKNIDINIDFVVVVEELVFMKLDYRYNTFDLEKEFKKKDYKMLSDFVKQKKASEEKEKNTFVSRRRILKCSVKQSKHYLKRKTHNFLWI